MEDSTGNPTGTTGESIRWDLPRRYQHHLDAKTAQLTAKILKRPDLKRVAIVGAGMAGLYSALLLKRYQPNLDVKIFEAADRVGGRVHTHWFENKENQYFEAGAMRIPDIPRQKPFFQLVEYLNGKLPDFQIKMIPYIFSCSSGNRVYVNKTKQKDGKIMTVDYANQHLDELGFSSAAGANKEAGKILQEVLSPIEKELHQDFDAALEKYDCMTLHHYLSKKRKWSPEKINFVEVMSSQTNEFHHGLVDQVILGSNFTGQVVPKWKTIDQGMCRLSQAMAKIIGDKNIALKTPITSLEYTEGGPVQVGYALSGQKVKREPFDAVILALPPSSVRMMPARPTWSVAFEQGLRSINFQPISKIGLRFKNRFWEGKDLRASKGGQSITDLPCRWVVYPSYGIGDKGKGVLLLYSWMTDSSHWLPKTKLEKINMALSNLQELYPEVNIRDLYAGGNEGDENYLKEGYPVEWAKEWSLGNTKFFPSQFSYLYPIMRQNQGPFYFAGEHLSVYHTWILGSLDSARYTVGQLLPNEKVEFLENI